MDTVMTTHFKPEEKRSSFATLDDLDDLEVPDLLASLNTCKREGSDRREDTFEPWMGEERRGGRDRRISAM